MRPILTYAVERWTLSNNNEETFKIYEYKEHWQILGPVNENLWRFRYNIELYRDFDWNKMWFHTN